MPEVLSFNFHGGLSLSLCLYSQVEIIVSNTVWSILVHYIYIYIYMHYTYQNDRVPDCSKLHIKTRSP